jgi:hypothetical protein
MQRFLVSANLLNLAYAHNVQSAKDAIIEVQSHIYEHKPNLWDKVKDAEWLATSDIPPVDETKAIVELCI